MGLQRLRDWPTPPPSDRENNKIHDYLSNLYHELQQESAARVLDLDILQLSHVPWVDVRTYGATGDGVADDTKYIQSALDASEGKVCFIPEGTFITDTLTIPSDTVLMGVGYGSCLKLKANTSTGTKYSILENEDPSGGDSNIKIMNLQFDGNKANQTAGTNNRNIRLENVTDSLITGCYVHDCYDATPGTFPDSRCISIENGSKRINIVGNWCYNSDGHGINCDHEISEGDPDILGMVIAFNHCYDNLVTGISFWRTIGTKCIGNTCYNNFRGIVCESSNFYTINSNYCSTNDTMGIYVFGGASGLEPGIFSSHGSVCNNVSMNNGQDGTGYGIRVRNQGDNNADEITEHITVMGNVCSDDQDTATQEMGIEVSVSNSAYADRVDYVHVIGNTCVGNATNNFRRGNLCNVNGRVWGNDFDEPVTKASAATVTLTENGNYYNITGTTNITSVTASWVGRVVTLMFSGVLDFTDGSNLKLAGTMTTSADDTITLVCDGTNWIEIARSAN